jgi:hypothetical protein
MPSGEGGGNVECLVLESPVFTEIVGNFKAELEHRMHLQDLDVKMSDLRTKAIVGRNTFEVVKLVHHQGAPTKTYALKCVSKTQVVRMHQQKSIQVEWEINAQCYHACIMQFIKAFQDPGNKYFLFELLGEGGLFFAIRQIEMMHKLQTQFYRAFIVLALKYLHERGIMYRVLKQNSRGLVVTLSRSCSPAVFNFGCLLSSLCFALDELISNSPEARERAFGLQEEHEARKLQVLRESLAVLHARRDPGVPLT